MMPNKKKIGIMGGTFDPIHYGHLYIAESARYKYGLEKVLFIPAGKPVHKTRNNITDAMHRTEMVRRAIQSNPFFELSTLEVERTGPTYAVDTLEELHKMSDGDLEFYYITGADAILDILTWKDVIRVFQLCKFIGLTRPGFSLEGMMEILDRLSEEQRAKISFYETAGLTVSSTEIRNLVADGAPIKYLVPESVEKYIIENKLYFL